MFKQLQTTSIKTHFYKNQLKKELNLNIRELFLEKIKY